MNIICIIQARVGSTRLPRKVLLPLEDKTVLEHVIARTLKSSLIEEVIVATTLEKEDLEIVKLVSSKGIRVFCGSKDDVLDRFYQAAKILNPKHIVRITSDCPLIDPDIIDIVIKKHLEENTDYTSNTLEETFPDGLDVEIFTFNALKEAWKNANLQSEREHVTPYIRKNPIFKKVSVKFDLNLSYYRWTLDREEDYLFLKEIFKNVYLNNPDFRMKDVLQYLEKNPHILEINNKIIRNEGYMKSLREDKKLNLDYLGE